MRCFSAGILVVFLTACTGTGMDDGQWQPGECFTDCGYTVAQSMALADCKFPKRECPGGGDCPVWISGEERADRMLHWVVLGRCENPDRPETWRCTAKTCVR